MTNPFNYEFSISNEACNHILHYYAKPGGVTHEVVMELYRKTGMQVGERAKYLTKKEVIFGLEALISFVGKSANHEYRVLKLKSFLTKAVYIAAEDEIFYLRVQSEIL